MHMADRVCWCLMGSVGDNHREVGGGRVDP